MSLTKEELMRPRYKLVHDYPGCPFIIGDVVTWDSESDTPDHSFTNGMYYIWDPQNYPGVFRMLHWSDDRTLGEMPEYVAHKVDGEVFTPEWYPQAPYLFDDPNNDGWQWMAYDFVPSTREAYEAQQSKSTV